MKFTILIAEPRDILRAGLRTIFVEDDRTGQIYEASTLDELQAYLQTTFDLAIVNQSLITDMSLFPRGHFIIIAAYFDMDIFLSAYKHGARGYMLENSPAELLRATLSLPNGSFMIEPTTTTNIIEFLCGNFRFVIKEELLTPREKEIVDLLQAGIKRRTIADKLSISEATLKTHIKNITKKHAVTL